MEEIRIQMSSKGPYMIKGYKVIVIDSEGNEIEKEGTAALCHCSPIRSHSVTVPTATLRPSELDH